MLRILLLGTPVTSLDDTPLKITRKLQRALLFYLAERGGPVGREELVGMLWPEESEEDAHRRLSQALARLRSELPDRDLLLIDVSQVCLDFKQVYVDAREFRTLIVQQVDDLRWQDSSQSPLTNDNAQALTRALRLWRSSQFMAGCDLPDSPVMQNWYATTRQELEMQRQRLAERLADHAMAHGDLETALQWLLVAFQNEDKDEDLNCRILTLMIDLGQKSAALNFFNHLQELYNIDDDWPVPQAILNVISRISEENDANLPTLPGWPAMPGYQFPLVGRKAILRELQTAFCRGGIVLLHGEAGSGKTRVVQEFFYGLPPSPRLLLASAHSTESRLPFQVIIEMLRRYITVEDWQKLSPSWGRPIAALLPELQVIRPEFVTSLVTPDGPTTHALLFEAIRQLLLQVAQQQRLLFFLDDAQWADESSLLALSFLLRHSFFDRHGLLVIAARSEDHHPQLETFLDSVRRFPTCHEASLPPLNDKEIAELAGYALGQPMTDALVDRLAKDTGGNPLFILMTLRSLLDLQIDPNAIPASDALPLASGIHALVRERLSEVNPQTRQVVLTMAVIGSTFELEVLEKASQIPEEAITLAVEEMENLGLIHTVNAQPPQRFVYGFVHDKFREALLLEASLPRRRLLHRRVARALQTVLGDGAMQQAAILAQHYESAGDLILAFDWWLQAAQHARKFFSLNEAEADYKRAEELLQTLGREFDDKRVYDLYANWGEMIFEAHGIEPLERVYSTLLRLGQERQSPLLIGTALSGLCDVTALTRNPEKGLEYADQALVYLTRTGNLFELAQAHNRRGDALSSMERYAESRVAFEQALVISKDCQSVECMNIRAACYYNIALFLRMTGWPGKGIAVVENALKENPFQMLPYRQLCLYLELVIANNLSGNYSTAQKYTQKGLDLAQKLQNWRLLGYIQTHAAQTELALGNLDASFKYVDQAMQLGRSHNLPVVLTRVYISLGDIFYSLGAYNPAIEAYQKGIEISTESNKSLELMYRLGGALSMVGQVESGMALLPQVISQAQAIDIEAIAIPAHVSLGRIYFAGGEVEKAWQEVLLASHQAQERGLYLNPPYANLVLGHFALSGGDTSAAKNYARLMVDQPKQPGNVIEEIGGLGLLRRALRLEQQDDSQVHQRLIQRLDEMGALAKREEIAPYFCAFREKLLAPLQA